MTWRAQIDDRGLITRYKDTDTGEVISAKEYERRTQMQGGHHSLPGHLGQLTAVPGGAHPASHLGGGQFLSPGQEGLPALPAVPAALPAHAGAAPSHSGLVPPPPPTVPMVAPGMTAPTAPAALPVTGFAAPHALTPDAGNPLIQPGAKILTAGQAGVHGGPAMPAAQAPSQPPTAGQHVQGKNLRMEGLPHVSKKPAVAHGYKAHGFLDATSIAILLPTLVLLALIIAAAHKKRLFPWQTIRTFNPPSGLLTPREYERSYLCPPNLRRHGRVGKRNPNATWTEQDGIVLPFGFLARTHLPVTIPLGRLPNKNMFIVAPSGSGKTTLMRAIIKALMAKPCVIIALEAKANDPNLDETKEGFKYTVLPEAEQAGFSTLYFNPLDSGSIHWNPLDLDPITFASSIVQDVNSLPPEEQHWAERDHGYISGLVTLLKWGAVMVAGEDENGVAADVQPLPCNPRGLMRLVNNRRNIVESLRRLKNNQQVDAAELSELTQTLSSIIRTDNEWDKNIQGVRGRLRMFKNPNVLRVTEKSNIDMRAAMYKPTVLIFGAPASLGPDAESLAACFVYQLQQALHTRYGTKSVLPLFAFFDEYQTLNIDIAGRLSAIVRGANGGLAVILQNISQIAGKVTADPTNGGASELKTIFSNSAIRVCLHNADESTAKFFSDEIGKHAIIVPGISDHYDAKGFGIFPSTWNRIHSQQVVSRVDTDSIKRMEKQHALVYLSPAGDTEFGETKPLMVDLRGIEEIAKLHLLHNVSGRILPPGGTPGTPPPAPPSGGPGGGDGFPAAPAGSAPDAAAMSGNGNGNGRICPHCGQSAGKGRFCIECGRPLPAANNGTAATTPAFAVPGGLPQEPPAISEPEQLPAGVAEFHGAPGIPEQVPLAAPAGPHMVPPFATAIGQTTVPPAGVPEHDFEPAPAEAAAAPHFARPAQRPQQQAPAPQFAASRFSAGASAGAISAQQATPVRPAPQALRQPEGSGAAPHSASQAPARPQTPHRDGQRPPVTSLNPDPSTLGIPQAPRPSAEGRKQPAPPRGVEF